MKAQLLFYPVTEQLFVFNESQVRYLLLKKKIKKVKKRFDILCSNDYYIIMLISQRRNNMEKTNINALSNIWKEWCEANNIPKHDNGQHYSADDIIFDYCQVMPFCPNEKQSAFISAFKEVWIQTIQH